MKKNVLLKLSATKQQNGIVISAKVADNKKLLSKALMLLILESEFFEDAVLSAIEEINENLERADKEDRKQIKDQLLNGLNIVLEEE